jgi:hypothetical protein
MRVVVAVNVWRGVVEIGDFTCYGRQKLLISLASLRGQQKLVVLVGYVV